MLTWKCHHRAKGTGAAERLIVTPRQLPEDLAREEGLPSIEVVLLEDLCLGAEVEDRVSQVVAKTSRHQGEIIDHSRECPPVGLQDRIIEVSRVEARLADRKSV